MGARLLGARRVITWFVVTSVGLGGLGLLAHTALAKASEHQALDALHDGFSVFIHALDPSGKTTVKFLKEEVPARSDSSGVTSWTFKGQIRVEGPGGALETGFSAVMPEDLKTSKLQFSTLDLGGSHVSPPKGWFPRDPVVSKLSGDQVLELAHAGIDEYLDSFRKPGVDVVVKFIEEQKPQSTIGEAYIAWGLRGKIRFETKTGAQEWPYEVELLEDPKTSKVKFSSWRLAYETKKSPEGWFPREKK